MINTMVEISAFISQVWFLVLFSFIASLLVFPLVILSSFLYSYLEKRSSKTPKILLMLVCTFAATLLALIVLEVYLGFNASQVFSTT